MDDPALWHRLQFAFTVTYHYLFPQLTKGLAWFLVFWKWRALRTRDAGKHTDAFMQHTVGPVIAANGTLAIDDLSAYLLNPWVAVQFAHNQAAALVTGTFVVTAVGAFYVLREAHRDQARLYLKHGAVPSRIRRGTPEAN